MYIVMNNLSLTQESNRRQNTVTFIKEKGALSTEQLIPSTSSQHSSHRLLEGHDRQTTALCFQSQSFLKEVQHCHSLAHPKEGQIREGQTCFYLFGRPPKQAAKVPSTGRVGTVHRPEASTSEARPVQLASYIILQVRSLGLAGFLTPFCPILTKSEESY